MSNRITNELKASEEIKSSRCANVTRKVFERLFEVVSELIEERVTKSEKEEEVEKKERVP